MNSQRDLALITNGLQTKLQHLSNCSISIASDSRVIRAVKMYPKGPGSDAEKSALRLSLGGSIRAIIGASSDIYMWEIYSLSGRPFGLGGYDLTQLTNQLDERFFRDCAASLSARIFGPYTVSNNSNGFNVFMLTKVIADLDTRSPCAILMMLVRENRISSLFTRNMTSSSVAIHVMNDQGQITSSRDKQLLGENAAEACGSSEDDMERLLEDKLYITPTMSGPLYALSDRITEDGANWRVLMINNMTGAQNSWRQTVMTTVAICAVACLCLLVVSYFIARTVSRPIRALAGSMQQAAESGNLKPVDDPRGSCEVSVLYNGINHLLSRIRRLIDNINREQEEKTRYQFQLIQAQIKPHFLYNTLETIKSLIDLDMNDTASECVYAMAAFYRLSLNRGNDILSVRDEVELNRQYMYIQKLRYIDRLDYEIDVDSSLDTYDVPKMMLQPILENAIYHGIKEKPGRGFIRMTGRDEGDTMVFCVRDNGNGMSSEALSALRASISGSAEAVDVQPTSFGLYSISRRVHILYREHYDIQVESELGEFTAVTLTLPKRMIHKGGEAK